MLQQMGQMLQNGGGSSDPVNWSIARDTARKVIAAEGDPTVSAGELHETEEAIALAETWIDGATVFPSTGMRAGAWCRSEWLEATFAAWQRIIGPLGEQASSMMSQALPGQAGAPGLPTELGELPPEFASMLGPLLGMAKQMGAMSLGSQFGQGLGALAGEVLSASDIGVPLTDEPRPILIPRNVAAFGEGLDIPADEVRIYLALREVAHERLFAHVPWLRPRVLGAIEEYARGIHFDADRWTDVMRDVDPQNPAALQEALGSGLFEPEDTPAQRAALARMETLLALVEGWVEAVVVSSSSGRLPSADRLAETMRRRRAAGGPAEHTLANLVGLELRPRRLREAAALWLTVALEHGVEGRDALWGHPDLLPAGDDFDDPDGFVERSRPELPE
jgi:hypothetical protein